jgi:hypothetical protein
MRDREPQKKGGISKMTNIQRIQEELKTRIGHKDVPRYFIDSLVARFIPGGETENLYGKTSTVALEDAREEIADSAKFFAKRAGLDQNEVEAAILAAVGITEEATEEATEGIKTTGLNTLSIQELENLAKAVQEEIKSRTEGAKKVIVSMPEHGDPRFRKWAKTVTKVDQTKQNGYCFEGDFISGKAELEVGSVILYHFSSGSVKNHDCFWQVWRVTDNDTPQEYQLNHASNTHTYQNLEYLFGAIRDNRKTGGWALDIRDQVAELLK